MNAEIVPKIEGKASESGPGAPAVLHFGDVVLDMARGELNVAGATIPVRPKTFALLTYLAKHPRRLLTKDELMQAVWPDVAVTDDSLVQCVSELRSALGDRNQSVIKTVPRRGYLFDAQFTAEPPAGQSLAGARSDSATDLTSPTTAGGWRARPIVIALLLICVVGVGALVAQWTYSSRAGPEASLIGRHSIAILPLGALGDANAASLADAITEDLIVDVSRLPDTFVIARSSAKALAGQDIDMRDVRRRLGVAYVLNGSVQRRGSSVSIAVRLHATDDGAIVWSERFDYPDYADPNWQRDITTRIANSLNVRLHQSPSRSEIASAGRTPSAIEATLEGWHLLRRLHTRDGPARSRALFEQALASDPAAASALTGLALSYMTEVFNRWSDTPDVHVAKAAQPVEKALASQPNDWRANHVRSLVLYAQGRIEEAEQVTERVLLLYPNQPRALQRLGFLRLQQGRPGEVAAPVELSLRLDPLDAEQVSLGHFTLGMAEFHLGNDDAAYAHMRKAAVASPQNGFAWQWMAAIDALHGRLDQAKINLAEFGKSGHRHTVESLKASEPSRNATFWAARERFYEGLHKAGLPLSANAENR
jgi:TolB-like protein/DNA-binding winged helix-turn-helix (wHTH) protein/Tfp pilus assembly protein PilF